MDGKFLDLDCYIVVLIPRKTYLEVPKGGAWHLQFTSAGVGKRMCTEQEKAGNKAQKVSGKSGQGWGGAPHAVCYGLDEHLPPQDPCLKGLDPVLWDCGGGGTLNMCVSSKVFW